MTAVPRYKQIYEVLKNKIMLDIYQKGSLFPTEKDLMEEYGASRTTIRNALRLLHDECLIESHRGVGTVVTTLGLSKSRPQMSRITDIAGTEFSFSIPGPHEESFSDAIVDIVPASENASTALEVEPGQPVYRIRWLHSVNNIPYNFLTNYLRMDIVPDLDKRLKNLISLYRFLFDEYGLSFTEGREIVIPLCANFIQARFLGVDEGTPLLKLCRTAYCEKGPLEYSESILNTNILKITMVLGHYTPDRTNEG